MKKISRMSVLIVICIMISLFFLMTLVVFKQERWQKKIDQKVDYTYRDFAQKNKNVKDGVIVLAYHRILKNNKTVDFAKKVSKNPQLQQYNVAQNEFIRQMKWLKDNNVSVWSTDELIKHSKENNIKGKHVVLTFDDIDTTLPRNAAQTMFNFSFPFTIFVITGQTGRNLDGEQMATWSEIARLAGHKEVTVGLHTNDLHYQVNNHPILSSGKLSKHTILEDYKKSQQKMKKELSINTHVFAYPYGSENKTLTEYMYLHGMNGIFLLEPGVVTNDMSDILKRIPRFIVTDSNFNQLGKWLNSR